MKIETTMTPGAILSRGFWILCAAAIGFSNGPDLSGAETAAPDAANLRTFLELARKDVRKEKALLLSQNLSFADNEAAVFWPLYNKYELELAQWYDQRRSIVEKYFEGEKTLNDQEARKLADQAFKLEEQRTKLKRKYYKKFRKIIGARKAAQFFQIENQLNAAIDLYLAATLPLIK